MNNLLEQRINALEGRVTNMEIEVALAKGTAEGQRVRIDRLLGGIDDLQKRFEAWKAVGNEMGATVAALQQRGETYDEMWQRQQQANFVVTEFMGATSDMLKELLNKIKGDDDADDIAQPALHAGGDDRKPDGGA